MNKKIEKKIKELKDLTKEDDGITMFLAIDDGKKINTLFQGSIMGVANLLANFKDTDREFRISDQLCDFLIKTKKATEKISMLKKEDMADFMRDVTAGMKEMEKK